jgi:hypothetical protein
MHEYTNFPKLPQSIIQELYDWFNLHRASLVPIEGFDQFRMMPQDHRPVDSEHPLSFEVEKDIGIPTRKAVEFYGNEICFFNVMPAPPSVNKWIEDNIPVKGVYASIQEFTNGKFWIPHRDLLRDVAYNYVLETGGDNVKTCFYKPKPEYEHLNVSARTCIPYDRIDLIESTVFEKDQWHKIDVSKIHSVENIDPTKRRFSLSLSILN